MRTVTEDQHEQRNPTANDTSARQSIVSSLVERNAKLKSLKMEIKELEDSAWEACGNTPKAIRQLAKEMAWDPVKREKQRQLEEEIDQGRLALGLLADTPLGQAEMERMEQQRQSSMREPQHHATNPKHKAKRAKRAAPRQQPEPPF